MYSYIPKTITSPHNKNLKFTIRKLVFSTGYVIHKHNISGQWLQTVETSTLQGALNIVNNSTY